MSDWAAPTLMEKLSKLQSVSDMLNFIRKSFRLTSGVTYVEMSQKRCKCSTCLEDADMRVNRYNKTWISGQNTHLRPAAG